MELHRHRYREPDYGSLDPVRNPARIRSKATEPVLSMMPGSAGIDKTYKYGGIPAISKSAGVCISRPTSGIRAPATRNASRVGRTAIMAMSRKSKHQESSNRFQGALEWGFLFFSYFGPRWFWSLSVLKVSHFWKPHSFGSLTVLEVSYLGVLWFWSLVALE